MGLFNEFNFMISKFLKYFFFFTIPFILSACHTGKKIQIDLNQISTLDYYKADIEGKKLFVKFDEVGENYKGKFFIADNKAIVDITEFTALQNKDLIEVEFDKKGEKQKLYGSVALSGDTIALMWFVKKRNKKYFKVIPLIKESPQDRITESNRYKNEIFSGYNVSTKIYGTAEGYYSSKHFEVVNESNYANILFDVGKNIIKNVLLSEINLDMDIYEPKNDTAQKRPVIVLIHGGSFMIGDKKVETMVGLADYYTNLGYVVASINYRLGFVIMPGSYDYLERSIYRANQDARAAIRYLVSNEKKLRIDTDNIFVAGTSAGGFTALNVAFMEEKERYPSTKGNIFRLQNDLDCIDCSTNKFKNSFSVKAIVNMWGALTEINHFDENEKIPILCIHGNADKIVPINYDFPFKSFNPELASFFSKKVWGSREIYKRAQSYGIKSKLVELADAGHEPQIDDKNNFTEHFNTIKTETRSFLYECLSDYNHEIIGAKQINENDKILIYTIENKPDYKFEWNIIGGKIIESSKNNSLIKVVWFSNSNVRKLMLKIQNKSGAISVKELILS